MLPSKIYSHYKYVSRVKSKSKTPMKSQQQTRNRSITYVNDQTLIKSIDSSEQLLDWILIEQNKKKEVQEQLPPIITVPAKKDKIQMKARRLLHSDQEKDISIVNYKDPDKIAIYQKLNIYGKFLEPAPVKKFEYNQTKTLETAISQIIESQHNQKTLDTNPQMETWKRIDSPIDKTLNESVIFQQQYDANPYAEQSKINQIINKALYRWELIQNPVNASKSKIQRRAKINSYLDKQFKVAQVQCNQIATPSEKSNFISRSQQIMRQPFSRRTKS